MLAKWQWWAAAAIAAALVGGGTVARAQAPAPIPADGFELTDVTGEVVERSAAAWRRVEGVWNYELTQVDGKAITVSRVVICLALLWAGYVAAKVASKGLSRRLSQHLGMHASAVAPVQSISFYVLLATFTLLSLHLANVPLTAFTFLGGAIAIGVGFGSQNIVNNFISGLILLAERPIRVGDIIQVDGLTGKVTQIGARSTKITTGTNLEILVPNSKFLENNVVNWTLSDDRIRTKINVGVSYGSPTTDVAQLLEQAAREHPYVLQDAEPFVLFAEFGDNALLFELHFWISLGQEKPRSEVESDVRFRIDALFREAGIVMAYPQRDIHLDVLRPLEVRVVEAASPRRVSGLAA